MDLTALAGLLGQSWVTAIAGTIVGAFVSLAVASAAIKRSTAGIARQVNELENVIGYVRVQMAGLLAQTERVEAQAAILKSESDRLIALLERFSRPLAEPAPEEMPVGTRSTSGTSPHQPQAAEPTSNPGEFKAAS